MEDSMDVDSRRARIEASLARQMPEGCPCPTCGKKGHKLAGGGVDLPTRTFSGPGAARNCAPLICEHCGNIQLFDISTLL